MPSTRRWFGPGNSNSTRLAYGRGVGVGGTPDDRRVAHSSVCLGINSKLDMFLDTGYTVAVMSNYDMAAMGGAEKIRELLERLQ